MRKNTILHVHGMWGFSIIIFLFIGFLFNSKIIISPHGMLEPWSLSKSSLKKKVVLKSLMFILRNVKCYHCTSEQEAINLSKVIPLANVEVIPNCVKIVDIDEPYSRTFNILFMSRIHEKKGLEYLIQAISRLEDNLQDNISLHVAGSGNVGYIKGLKKLSILHGIDDKIHFYGHVMGSKKNTLFEKCDLFVLPTFSENFGISIAEALSRGIPVITTLSSSWWELEKEKCGYIVEEGNADALCESIYRFYNQPFDQVVEMSNRGRYLTRDKYDCKNVMINLFSMVYGHSFTT